MVLQSVLSALSPLAAAYMICPAPVNVNAFVVTEVPTFVHVPALSSCKLKVTVTDPVYPSVPVISSLAYQLLPDTV